MDSTGSFREKLPTLLDAGEISFSGNYVPSNATQVALQAAFNAKTLSNWKIVLPASSIATVGNTTPGFWSFMAYVVGLDFDLQHDKEAKVSGKLMITGPRTYTPEAA
jgi:predicted secreted protein